MPRSVIKCSLSASFMLWQNAYSQIFLDNNDNLCVYSDWLLQKYFKFIVQMFESDLSGKSLILELVFKKIKVERLTMVEELKKLQRYLGDNDQ